MGGLPRPTNTRMTVILPRAVRAWLDAEGERIGLTASDVVRAAIAHFRAESPAQRARTIRATASEQEEAGGEMPGPRR